MRSLTVERDKYNLRANSAIEIRASRLSKLSKRLSDSSVIISSKYPWLVANFSQSIAVLRMYSEKFDD